MSRSSRRAEQKKKTKNMKTKQIEIPGPDHPISIQPNPARVVVSVAGRAIAGSRATRTVKNQQPTERQIQ
jgi:uncharacterized protein (DUF427 family)